MKLTLKFYKIGGAGPVMTQTQTFRTGLLVLQHKIHAMHEAWSCDIPRHTDESVLELPKTPYDYIVIESEDNK